MTRAVAVLSRPPHSSPAPSDLVPGLRAAMVEDIYAMVCDLQHVTPVLVLVPGDQPDVAALAPSGGRVVRRPQMQLATVDADGDAAEIVEVFRAVAAGDGASSPVSAVALLSGDAPDLPGLLVGKLFRALGSADVAVCPAMGGGLVAVASRVPVPDWLLRARAGLDTTDAVDRLRAAAPHPRALGSVPGWHRVRVQDDLDRLDPGLDGWDATRTLLGR